MKVFDSNVCKDLSKACLDVAKYVLTAAIIAPFLGGFGKNTAIMYLAGSGVFVATLIGYCVLYLLSKKQENHDFV
jgi:uncharacterized membrane protein YraQ (UPF0718 family)